MSIESVGPPNLNRQEPKTDPPGKQEISQTKNSPQQTGTDNRPESQVQISHEARELQSKQAEVTRFQIIARAASAISDRATEIEKDLVEIEQARADGRTADVSRVTERLERHQADLVSSKNAAQYNEENLFDGRSVKVETSEGSKELKMPDASRGIDDYLKHSTEIAQGKKNASRNDFMAKTRELVSTASDIQTRIEKEVRDTIEKAVRQSSGSRLSDAGEAEKLIRQTARQVPKSNSQRPPATRQLDGSTVNILK